MLERLPPHLRTSAALKRHWDALLPGRVHSAVVAGAAQESDMPNFKGSDLGRFPLVSADFWTSDHLSERPRSVGAFFPERARARNTR